MRRVQAALLLVTTFASVELHAGITIGETTSINFATVDEARQVLTSRDDFVESMSPFDRAARLKTDSAVSEEEYLAFVGENVLPWTDDEKKLISSAMQGIQKELEALHLPLPERLLVVKTTGQEEGGAPYTRANAIVFPEAVLNAPITEIRKILGHEIFHILSRTNPGMREQLYGIIGFVSCGELSFPPGLAGRKITNPDAPKNQHCIGVTVDGKKTWSIPILYSSSEQYDPARGGEFFNYLEFRLLVLAWDENTPANQPQYDKEPKLVGLQQASGFFEQVGRNTQYLIHPEEILADNFAFLLLNEQDLPSQEIVDKMERVLRGNGITE